MTLGPAARAVSGPLAAAAAEEADVYQGAPYQRGLSFHVVLLFLKTDTPNSRLSLRPRFWEGRLQ